MVLPGYAENQAAIKVSTYATLYNPFALGTLTNTIYQLNLLLCKFN